MMMMMMNEYTKDQVLTDAAAYALADASCSLTRWQHFAVQN